MASSRCQPKSLNFKWQVQDGRQKVWIYNGQYKLAAETTILDIYVQFLNAIRKASTFLYSKFGFQILTVFEKQTYYWSFWTLSASKKSCFQPMVPEKVPKTKTFGYDIDPSVHLVFHI